MNIERAWDRAGPTRANATNPDSAFWSVPGPASAPRLPVARYFRRHDRHFQDTNPRSPRCDYATNARAVRLVGIGLEIPPAPQIAADSVTSRPHLDERDGSRIVLDGYRSEYLPTGNLHLYGSGHCVSTQQCPIGTPTKALRFMISSQRRSNRLSYLRQGTSRTSG